MKSPSIERIYNQINKTILLAESYTEIKNLSKIIKACRLKPYSFLFKKNFNKYHVQKHWVDEFSNSFKIDKNKKIKIIFNDLTIKKPIICTDLYYGLNIEKIIKISKLFFIRIGLDYDSNIHILISLIGIDDYIRTYLYEDDGNWKQISSLFLGFNKLQKIFNHLDIKYFLNIKNKENFPVPCYKYDEWISFMPVHGELIKDIDKNYNVDLNSLFRKDIL